MNTEAMANRIAADIARYGSVNAPRPHCVDCTRKHLGQAIVLLQESLHGYPLHVWLAIGHMAEAEAEIEGIYPDLAKVIRGARKQVEVDVKNIPNLLEIIHLVTQREDGNASGCGLGSCGV